MKVPHRGVAGESDGGDGGVGLKFGVLDVSQVDMHVVGVDTDEAERSAASSREERFSLFVPLF